jgi:hypothetical protein
MLTTLNAALRYADLGIPVFPCNNQKKPCTDNGFKDATTDKALLERWWGKWPDAMIGMPTGKVSGINVLDLDVDPKKGKNGKEQIPNWETLSPIIVRTPRTGAHIYFKYDGANPIRNSTDTIALGVDTRGDGGYVILPPSQNGAASYEFVNGDLDGLATVPPFPADLLAKVKGEKKKKKETSDKTANIDLVRRAVEVIPNKDDLGWDDWNNRGMAIWAATKGSEEGFQIFDSYSKKSKKYDETETRDRWDHYKDSPPTDLGAGTLFFLANLVEPNWRADKDVAEVNETYALVLVGGTAGIMKFKPDQAFDLLKPGAFSQWLANKNIFKKNSEGETVCIPLAKYWLTHKERRQYEGIIFKPNKIVPGFYNLWKGFSVEPKKGEWLIFKSHLENLFGDDYKWAFAWFAQMFQHPETKPGTSIVLRGPQGVGKTKIGEVFGSLFFELHYVLVADPRFVIGRFNSHLVSCILLHADEAFWAGDKQSEGKLKDLITGNRYFIEFKGKEPVPVDNNIRLLVCGNQDWVVPAGYDERRFAVWDVNEQNQRNYEFFDAIDREMDNGGREALLYDLLNFDLSKVNLREIPKTVALLEQKVQSQDDKSGWWLDTLMRGALPAGCVGGEYENCCPKDKLFEKYIQHSMKAVGSRRRAIETSIGMFLNKLVPGIKHHKDMCINTDLEGEPRYGRAYEFPPLKNCREPFEKRLQQSIDWGGDSGDWSYDYDQYCDKEEEEKE